MPSNAYFYRKNGCHFMRSFLIICVMISAGCSSMQSSKVSQVRIEVEDDVGFTITEKAGISGKARASYQEAHELFSQGRYEDGIRALEELVEKEPQLSAPRIDLAVALHETGELDSAVKHLELAVEQNPRHPIALNELGIVYRKTGKFAAARNSYEKALDIYPGFHAARRNLAVLCDLYLGDLKCALDNYEAYMGTVVEDPEAAIWIADIRNRIDGQEALQ
jgi:tetratricopeptide (TPR) repeat protein